MTLGQRGTLLLAAYMVLVSVVACTPRTPTVVGETTPPLVHHPEVAPPADRDPRAVLAALGQVDLCAVLGIAVDGAPLPSVNATPTVVDSFSCQLQDPQDYTVNTFLTLKPMSPRERIKTPSTVVGGAKAYLSGSDRHCSVDLPVSFEWVLSLDVPGACEPATQLAAAVVVALTDPAAAVPPHWDACTATAAATGMPDDAVEYELELGTVTCGDASPTLALSRGTLPAPTETVGGRVVSRSTEKGRCAVTWEVAAAPPNTTTGALLATVTASKCPAAERYVEPFTELLATAPPAGPVQQPLLYSPEESDIPRPGACAYYDVRSPAETCQPAVDVPVPAERAEFVRAAERDPNVYCALARDAIAEHFGPQLQPVTVVIDPTKSYNIRPVKGEERLCYFVEPTRTVQVAVGMLREPVDDLAIANREEEIGGGPAYVEVPPTTGTAQQFHIWAGMTDHPDRDGTILLVARAGPVATFSTETELDPATFANARAAIGAIVTEHFA